MRSLYNYVIIMALHACNPYTGPPLAPVVNSSFPSVTEILLEWNKPFTWPDHNITHYVVTEVMDGNRSSSNTTAQFHSYKINQVAESCVLVTFMVTAVSDLGGSDPGVSSGGLPIGKWSQLTTPQKASASYSTVS